MTNLTLPIGPGCPFCCATVRNAGLHGTTYLCGTRLAADGSLLTSCHHCERPARGDLIDAAGRGKAAPGRRPSGTT